MRRHLLFCDDCNKLVVAEGGEVEDDEIEAPTLSPPPDPSAGRRWAWIVVLAVMGLAASLYLVFRTPPPVPRPALRDAELHSLLRGPVRDRLVQPDEPIAVSLSVAHARRLFVYVLAMMPDASWHRLEPTPSSAPATDVTGTVWLPPGAEPGAAERRGWRLGELSRLRAGDHVGLFVLLAPERIEWLEGDQLARTTLPRFERDFAPDEGLDAAHVERVRSALVAMKATLLVAAITVRVEPL